MKQLSTIRSKARSFSWHGFRKRLSGANGAIDLASIMVGVIVIGVVAGVISATVGAVIPWSQDQAAKGNLTSVAVAESGSRTAAGSYFAYDSHPDSEYQAAENSWLQRPEHRLVIETSDNGMSWLAVTKSASGKIFMRTSASPEVYEAEDQGLNDQLLSTGITEATAQEAVTAVADGSAFTFKSTSKLGYGPGTTAAALPEAPEVSARMVSTWDTNLGGSLTLTLPLWNVGGSTTIDWGDGTVTPAGEYATHTYLSHGVKTVAIEGAFGGWGWKPVDDGIGVDWSSSAIVSVTEWGATGTSSLYSGFDSASNLVALANPTSHNDITDMSFAFAGASSFNQDIGNWDVSGVIYTSWMFVQASSFNQDISSWKLSSVEAVEHMFYYASSFNQDISNWDIAHVTVSSGFADYWGGPLSYSPFY